MRDRYIAEARDFLVEAINMGFEAVMIVGMSHDGCVTATKSRVLDMMKFAGAIELAKWELMKAWDRSAE